jgi:Barnase-EndoU-ColicinE5/D-RelE like nuclease
MSSEADELTQLLGQMRGLAGNDCLQIGQIPAPIEHLWPDVASHRIIVTGERRRHYLDRHPLTEQYELDLVRAVRFPDEIFRNRMDAQVAILYRRIDDRYRMRVALLVSQLAGLDCSVLSAWPTRPKDYERDRRSGRLLWRRED